MFIHYTGPSPEKQPGARGTINAVVAVNANLRRQRRKRIRGSLAATLSWLYDRPLIIALPPEQAPRGAQDNAGSLIIKKEDDESTIAEALGMTTPQLCDGEPYFLWDGTVQRYLGDGVTYPTPRRPHYPALLFHRQNLFFLVAHQYPRTFSDIIYNTWTQEVMSDPCVFHATLFATSSIMDVHHQRQNNPVTLHHKGETVRLINQAVSQAPTSGLRDEIIAITTYMVYFAKLLGDSQEATKHDEGITAMLNFKGVAPTSLPQNTYMSYLLRLRDVWNGIVYRVDALFPFLAGPRASSGFYTSLLGIALQKQLKRPLQQRLPDPLLHFLIKFNNQCIAAVERKVSDPHHIPAPPVSEIAAADPEIHHAMQCIYLTAKIYWAGVTRDFATTAIFPELNTTITTNNRALQAALLHVNNVFWLRLGPEVLRWILMTGATAATCLRDQAFFILRLYMVTSVIKPEEMDEFLMAVDHLLWAFNHLVAPKEDTWDGRCF